MELDRAEVSCHRDGGNVDFSQIFMDDAYTMLVSENDVIVGAKVLQRRDVATVHERMEGRRNAGVSARTRTKTLWKLARRNR